MKTGALTTSAPKARKSGRPSKKVHKLLEPLLEQIASGESRRRAATAVGLSPKTVQRWMAADPRFRKSVEKAENQGRDLAPRLRWLNHPFRGRRPPNQNGQNQKPHPQPRFRH